MMKQTANRLLALLLAMMMTLSLAACGKAPQTGITDGSVYAFRVEKYPHGASEDRRPSFSVLPRRAQRGTMIENGKGGCCYAAGH